MHTQNYQISSSCSSFVAFVSSVRGALSISNNNTEDAVFQMKIIKSASLFISYAPFVISV